MTECIEHILLKKAYHGSMIVHEMVLTLNDNVSSHWEKKYE